MKVEGLADLICFSEKRRDLLFKLLESPRTLEQIRELLNVSTPNIQPRLKELKDEYMIEEVNGVYSLTPIGKVVTIHCKTFYETVGVVEKHKTFWNTHDLSLIPPEFLFRIRELNNCELIRLDDCDLFESHKEFMGNVANATSFRGVTCIFIREWVYLFAELSKEGIPIEIVITPAIYAKIQAEYSEELEHGLQNPNSHIYVCEEPLGVSFAAVDLLPSGKFFSLSLNLKNGLGHDHKQDLMGNDLEAAKWGEDLFEYYKARSGEIKIDQCMEICNDVKKELMMHIEE